MEDKYGPGHTLSNSNSPSLTNVGYLYPETRAPKAADPVEDSTSSEDSTRQDTTSFQDTTGSYSIDLQSTARALLEAQEHPNMGSAVLVRYNSLMDSAIRVGVFPEETQPGVVDGITSASALSFGLTIVAALIAGILLILVRKVFKLNTTKQVLVCLTWLIYYLFTLLFLFPIRKVFRRNLTEKCLFYAKLLEQDKRKFLNILDKILSTLPTENLSDMIAWENKENQELLDQLKQQIDILISNDVMTSFFFYL